MLPSEVKLPSYCGYYNKTFEGWKEMPTAAITGIGYTVKFYRLGERTIDPMCDALNGWHTVWTKFRFEYSDSEKTGIQIIVRKPEDADKLYKMMQNIAPMEFEHEIIMTAAEVARSKAETIVQWIKGK